MSVEFNEDSRLGTKEYWDHHYDLELENFKETGDKGDVWFGKSAENRILNFVAENVPLSATIIDFGCGNGSLLRKLRESGYTNLHGVDYSFNAIELARKTTEKDQEVSENKIMFEQLDLISDDDVSPSLRNQYDLVLDKGTWDALSLAGDRMKRLLNYKRKLMDVFKKPISTDSPRNYTNRRYFILFSCNFTKDELVDLFVSDWLKFHAEIPSQSHMSFGGKSGVATTGIVFRTE